MRDKYSEQKINREKRSKILRRVMGGVMALVLLFGMGVGYEKESVVSAASQTTIASLTYKMSSLSTDAVSTTDRTLNKTKYGSKSDGYSFTTGTAKLYASIDGSVKRKLEWSTDTYKCSAASDEVEPAMTAGKKFPWPSSGNPYFEIDFSTSGYSDVTFTAYVGATKKGPKNYHLAYAVGSSTSFTKLSGSSVSLSDNKLMTKITGTLPSAADDQSSVKVRVVVSDLTACNGNKLSADTTSGEAAINHITIAGTKASSSSSTTTDSSSKTGSSTSNSSSSDSTNSGASGSNGTLSSGSSTNSSSSNTTQATATVSGVIVKKLKLSKTKIKMKKGTTVTLKVTVKTSPNTKAAKKAVKKKLVWTSSKKSVATVTKSGKIKAKKVGKTTIAVQYGKKKVTCKVIVKK